MTSRASAQSILVRAPNWIGDQVLAFPFFHFLRKAYPNARIASICAPWVKDLQFRGYVDEVIALEKPRSSGLWERLRILEAGAKEIRALGPWDLAISLPNSFSAAWLLYRSGARQRRGFATEGRGFLLNQRLSWDLGSRVHRAQAYLSLLPKEAKPSLDAAEFWGIPSEQPDLDPNIPGELASFDPSLHWPTCIPLEPPQGPYWILAPGATAESRRWFQGSFASLARQVREQTGWTGIVVGGPAEAKLAEQLCESKDLGLENWCARGPVPVLSQLFKNAKFTVSNESGLAHVAAFCGSPVHIVCGAADPRRTEPLGPAKVRITMNPVECWPCERNTCDQPAERYLQCLKGIQPDQVWAEIQKGVGRGL